MVTENEIKNIIQVANEQIGKMETSEFSQGKMHRYLSKAFVAGLGRYFRSKYNQLVYDTRFQDFDNGKGISGEWLFDVAVCKVLQFEENGKTISYPFKIELALESEMAPGTKAFFYDFSKLSVVDTPHKIYINGVKNLVNKKGYIEKRLNLIKSVISQQTKESNYTICFIDHPSLWKRENVFVQIVTL